MAPEVEAAHGHERLAAARHQPERPGRRSPCRTTRCRSRVWLRTPSTPNMAAKSADADEHQREADGRLVVADPPPLGGEALPAPADGAHRLRADRSHAVGGDVVGRAHWCTVTARRRFPVGVGAPVEPKTEPDGSLARRLARSRRLPRPPRSEPRRCARSPASAASTPLTKRPESSVENRLASSTASSMTTATGTSGRSASSKAAMRSTVRSIDRHALQRPALGVRRRSPRRARSRCAATPVDQQRGQLVGRARPGRRAIVRDRARPSVRPRTAAAAPARGRRTALVVGDTVRRPRPTVGGAMPQTRGDVVAGAGVDLDPVADVDEQRHLDDLAGLQRGRLAGAATPGRPACPARSR